MAESIKGPSADTQTGLIEAFFGMLGLNKLTFTYAEGLAMGEEAAERSRAQAQEQILQLAA